MPLFFVVAIGTLAIDIADVLLGYWISALVSAAFWAIAVLFLGFGTDWNRRLVYSSAYASMTLSAVVAVLPLIVSRVRPTH